MSRRRVSRSAEKEQFWRDAPRDSSSAIRGVDPVNDGQENNCPARKHWRDASGTRPIRSGTAWVQANRERLAEGKGMVCGGVGRRPVFRLSE